MSRRASATLIGFFVMGALTLLVVGLLAVGAGRFGADSEIFVLNFRYSTSGLKVGAPVVLKGVQIGVVKDISVAYDEETDRFQVPVLVEIDQDRVQWPEEIRGELDSREFYEKALQAGLRARLGLQSLVTGMREIEVGFFPGTALVLSGKHSGYRELPTIPSAFDSLLGQVQSLPVEHVVERTLAILEGLNRLANAKEIPRILANLDTAMAELAETSEDVRKLVGPTGAKLDAVLDDLQKAARILSARLEGLLIDLEQAAEQVRQLAQDANAEMGPAARSLQRAGDSAEAAFDAGEEAFDAVSSVVGDRSPIRREALDALRSLSAASRALRDLADYLARHPDALIRGKR